MEFTGYFPEKSCMCESPNRRCKTKLKSRVACHCSHNALCGWSFYYVSHSQVNSEEPISKSVRYFSFRIWLGFLFQCMSVVFLLSGFMSIHWQTHREKVICLTQMFVTGISIRISCQSKFANIESHWAGRQIRWAHHCGWLLRNIH